MLGAEYLRIGVSEHLLEITCIDLLCKLSNLVDLMERVEAEVICWKT